MIGGILSGKQRKTGQPGCPDDENRKKVMKAFYKGPNIVDVVFVPLVEEEANL